MRGSPRQEQERGGPNDEFGRRDGLGRWIFPAGALTLVLVVIVVGAVRIATDGTAPPAGDPIPSAQPVRAPASTEPEPEPTSDADTDDDTEPTEMKSVWFVDVGTGETTPLPRSIRSIPDARQFDVAPGGGRVAFAAGGSIDVARIDEARVHEDGARVHEVASTPGASAPNWSPDGDRLVYTDGSNLFVVDLPGYIPLGGSVHRIRRPGGQIWHPNFSPDGRTILFTMSRGNGLDLWTVPTVGGESTRLVHLSANAAFGTYGPDGRIAYRRSSYDVMDITQMAGSQVWVAEADGTGQRPVGRESGSMSQIDPDSLWPAWSPDGSMIAFERLYQQGVFVVDVRTQEMTALGVVTNPTWVDDHTLIVEAVERYDPIS